MVGSARHAVQGLPDDLGASLKSSGYRRGLQGARAMSHPTPKLRHKSWVPSPSPLAKKTSSSALTTLPPPTALDAPSVVASRVHTDEARHALRPPWHG